MVRSKNNHFGAMYVSSAQQTCNAVAEAFKAFKALQELWLKGKLESKPAPPKYRKQGLYTVSYPVRWLKLTGDGIRIPAQVKAWFGIDLSANANQTGLELTQRIADRVLLCGICLSSASESVYTAESGKCSWHQLANLRGTSFIIDGLATLKEGQPQGFWSKQLAAITEKRNRPMRDAVNKAAKLIINHCLEHRIGTIVFGWNQGQKEGADMGRRVNQQFVQIPTARVKQRLAQLCEQYGIRFVETEEANTSAASFLDNDSLPKYGEKPEDWKASGQRVKRGLSNWFINADANGVANILRKVAATLGLNLSGVSRGALTTPLKVRFWTVQESPSL